MSMSTRLVHNPQTAFICLALSIVVFAALVRFVPGFAGPFQKFEDRLRSLFTGAAAASPATELASQVQILAADVQLLKSLIVPTQGVTQNPANLNALATAQAVQTASLSPVPEPPN